MRKGQTRTLQAVITFVAGLMILIGILYIFDNYVIPSISKISLEKDSRSLLALIEAEISREYDVLNEKENVTDLKQTISIPKLINNQGYSIRTKRGIFRKYFSNGGGGNWSHRRRIEVVEKTGTSGEKEALVELSEYGVPSYREVRLTREGETYRRWNYSFVEDEGLVGYWKFNAGGGKTAYDETINENHGKINGSSWTEGKYLSALSFDGSDDRVQTKLDIDQSSSTNGVTMMAWVYPKTVDGNRRQVISSDNGGYDWSLLTEDDWHVFVGNTSWSTGVSAKTDKWQHVAVVFTTNKVTFYKNSVPTPYGLSPVFDTSDNPIAIGDNPGGWDEFFNGKIDEVRIYNRALNQTEIQRLYEKGRETYLSFKLNLSANEVSKELYMYYGNVRATRPKYVDNTDLNTDFKATLLREQTKSQLCIKYAGREESFCRKVSTPVKIIGKAESRANLELNGIKRGEELSFKIQNVG